MGLTKQNLTPAVERPATLAGAIADSFETGSDLLEETAGLRNAGKLLNQMVDNTLRADILNHMVHYRSPSLDRVFHALAHPARRAMLRRLAEGDRNLSELAAPLRMSFPAASKHVRVLERARLVRRRVVGRTHLCRIEAKPLGDANEWLESYRQFWEGNFQRLDELLDELKTDEKKRRHTKR